MSADDYRATLAHPDDEAAVAVISAGTPTLEFTVSLTQSLYLDAHVGVQRFRDPWLIASRWGANLSRGRNELTRTFLELYRQPEWLFMVDDDMAWDASAFEQLLAHAAPDRIVGGLCFAGGRSDSLLPTVFFPDGESGWPKVVDEGWQIPNDALLEVAGTGAAFLCVHREGLERIAALEPWARDVWFREEWFKVPDGAGGHGQHYVAEDLFFCVQARRAGLSIWVDTSVEVKHCKERMLDRDTYEAQVAA
jgi:hypothetical protein